MIHSVLAAQMSACFLRSRSDYGVHWGLVPIKCTQDHSFGFRIYLAEAQEIWGVWELLQSLKWNVLHCLQVYSLPTVAGRHQDLKYITSETVSNHLFCYLCASVSLALWFPPHQLNFGSLTHTWFYKIPEGTWRGDIAVLPTPIQIYVLCTN